VSDATVSLVKARFDAFAGSFLSDPGDHFAYRIKIDHTARVADYAETIAREEGFAPDLILATRLAAVLHDVGRFPQYRAYGTFRDRESANHAALSVTHLLREHMLDGVAARIRKLVVGAVYLHNKRMLPSLPPQLATVARAVRDSDKLDIYAVMYQHFIQDEPKNPEIVLCAKDEPDAYSPGAAETLLRRTPGNYLDIVYINDFKLMVLGWVYDLNFVTSFRLLERSGLVDAIFDTLPQDGTIAACRKQVHGDLAQRLNRA
jgi:hypothetical protein